jgi:competence protein ComEC
MQIYTLNVGQGQFVVVTGNSEAFIVDTYIPLNTENEIVHVKSALSKILEGKNLVGLLITGFDSDHFNEVGMKVVLNKYRPDWIMYPKYFKETKTADSCFSVIRSFEGQKPITRHSMVLKENNRRLYNTLSNDFSFEVFSPHADDMNSSNNCSLVCKVTERSTGKTYLITGDTENDRWGSIVRYFGNSIRADVLAAPHHGSKNGISPEAMAKIQPQTVLISAGVNNQYGHPDLEATTLFKKYTEAYYSTSYGGGQSIRTSANTQEIKSFKFDL